MPSTPLLSDRAAVRVAFCALATLLVFGGIADAIRSQGMTRATTTWQPCGLEAPEGGGDVQLGACPGPAITSQLTTRGAFLAAWAALQILAAVVLLAYQAWRWSPARVEATLPRVPPKEATAPATPTRPEPWRDL